jgi:hypothetical protein
MNKSRKEQKQRSIVRPPTIACTRSLNPRAPLVTRTALVFAPTILVCCLVGWLIGSPRLIACSIAIGSAIFFWVVIWANTTRDHVFVRQAIIRRVERPVEYWVNVIGSIGFLILWTFAVLYAAIALTR